MTATVLRLRRLAARHDGRPPADLLRRLAAQLEPLAVASGPVSAAQADEIHRQARASLELLARKRAPVDEGRIGAASGTPPANDDCATAAVLVDGTLTGSTGGATADGAASCGGATDSDGGGIAGRVTKEATGEPLDGALVILHDVFGFSVDDVPTEADGSYVFGGLAAGSWYVRAFEQSLIGEVWNDAPCPGFCDVDAVGDVVTVGDGLSEGIDFALAAGGGITGTVKAAATADPVGFADVAAYDASGSLASSGRTDSLGRYLVPGLAAGSYTVRTFNDSYYDELYDGIGCGRSCDVRAGALVEVAAGSTTDGIDFELELLGSLSGRVTRSYDGAPLSNPFLEVFDAEGRWEGSAGIVFDGNYRLNGLQPGDHFVRTDDFAYFDELFDDVPCDRGSCLLAAGTPVPVALATETTGVDFVLDVRSLLTGSVTDADTGRPLDALMQVYDVNGFFATSMFNDRDTGIFEIVGLDPGTYFLVARPWVSPHEDQLYLDRGCAPSCTVTQGEPLVVESRAVFTGLDFALLPCTQPSHRDVSGTVSTEQTVEACRTVHATSLVVEDAGDLTLRAGRSVAFHGGVRIGGRLRVVVGPPASAP